MTIFPVYRLLAALLKNFNSVLYRRLLIQNFYCLYSPIATILNVAIQDKFYVLIRTLKLVSEYTVMCQPDLFETIVGK